MSESNNIPHNSWTIPNRHSDVWHEGVCANSRVEIKEKAPKPIVGGKFLLLEYSASMKGRGACHDSIVFISDFHWCGLNGEMYESLAKEISALEPDYILFGGDLGVFSDSIEDSMKRLSTMEARKGKFAVLGNRESILTWLDANFWRREYARFGFKYLFNEIADEGDLLFCGIDDYRFGTPDWSALKGIDRSRPIISLTHNPDAAASADLETFIGDIVLCGHTHGGQICFPLIGPLYTSSAFKRQFLHGWKTRDDGTLCLVSSGIGESGFGFARRRLRCPREVVLLRME